MKNTFSAYISFLQRDFLTYTKDQLKEINLTYGQLPFILYIGKHPDCKQSELIDKMHIDWGYSQRSINKLCDEDFVIKKADDDNGHTNFLSLTSKGEEAFELSHNVFFGWDSTCFEAISDEEKDILMSILNKIVIAKKDKYFDFIKSKR